MKAPTSSPGIRRKSTDNLSSTPTGNVFLCVTTAWHGDRLLSGGAVRIMRWWDVADSGEKCLHSM
jgi:hypothetical protein